MYDAVVFDMDGVLLTGYHTNRDVYREAARETLSAFDADVDGAGDDADPPSALVDPDDAADVRRVCERYDLPPAATWAYREGVSTELENRRIAAGERRPFEDTDALADLAASARLGVVSNNRRGTVRYVVRAFDWTGLVGAVQGRVPTLAGFDRLKPDPHYLDRALADLGASGSGVLYVGDRRTDVATADRAGVDAALLARDGEPPAGGPEPDLHVGSLRDLLDVVGG